MVIYYRLLRAYPAALRGCFLLDSCRPGSRIRTNGFWPETVIHKKSLDGQAVMCIPELMIQSETSSNCVTSDKGKPDSSQRRKASVDKKANGSEGIGSGLQIAVARDAVLHILFCPVQMRH